MSDTTPTQGAGQDEDTSGHAYSISDPGEVPTEGGRGQLPMPGDEDDTRGHMFVYATDDGSEDDTQGHKARDWVTGDATEDDAEGHRFAEEVLTGDGSEDDTQGHVKAKVTDDGSEDDTEGHRAMSSTVTDDGTEGFRAL